MEPGPAVFANDFKGVWGRRDMGKKKRNKKREAATEQSRGQDLFAGSIGDLLAAKGFTASSDATGQETLKQDPSPSLTEDVVARAQRWIVRISKKGRGGREATLLSARGLPENEDLSSLAKRIRKQMGCGASLEGADVLVQGDQRERLERWLVKQGARKVTQG